MSSAASGDFDVLIVGAGLPGLALALSLRGSGLRVGLVDRRQPVVDESQAWDSRIFALSAGNACFLHSIGVWPRLDGERLSAVETMRIFGDRPGVELNFSAFDEGQRALAWIAEQRELMSATLAAWAASADPEPVFAGSTAESLLRERDRVRLQLADGRMLRARLVVGADGLQSWTREQAGWRSTSRPYRQTAVVANFTTTLAHHGRAYQWFQPDGGILAWLPLPGRRISIVWSAPEARADSLLAHDDARFTDEVRNAGGSVLGELELLTARASYPLAFLRLSSPVSARVALVGDAAHGIHPLAGQGLNLGYGDVAALSRVLRNRGAIDDAGSNLLLAQFARERAWPVVSMQAVTDGLWQLFNARRAVPEALRNSGMALLDRLPAVKSALMQPAMR